MSNKILFVLEGQQPEKQITDNLTKFFVNENTIVTCAYCTTIYKLYDEISKDEDLDTFNLLKSISVNKVNLKEYNRADFAEIYMFFDYDGHATNANDDKLNQLLKFFHEETDKGKLYISYPMVESLKHIDDYQSFKNLTVKCKENIDYKKIVRNSCLKDLKHIIHYDLEIWKKLIEIHLTKMNKIVNEKFVFPEMLIEQLIIL